MPRKIFNDTELGPGPKRGRPKGVEKFKITLYLSKLAKDILQRLAFTTTSQGAVIEKLLIRKQASFRPKGVRIIADKNTENKSCVPPGSRAPSEHVK